ncbi:hypothetical protein [Staphylococcus caeli]|uniref:hypothetical protein n=1 Tax=Staphylococcus caeli TaxID=2201815 RepID=UPI003F54CC76
MKKIDQLIKEVKRTINSDIKLIEEHIKDLEEIKELKSYMNFEKTKDILSECKQISIKICELSLDSNYNSNFINYIEEEKNNIKHVLLGYKDENFKQKITKIKNNEINYDNIEIKIERIGYGGGRPPINSDEEILYSILYIENSMLYYLENLNNLLNNINILKDFSEIDTNAVIIGSNGSGKSTLSRRLKVDNISQSINIVSSHHILYLSGQNYIAFENKDDYFDVNIYQEDPKMVTSDIPFDVENFNNSFYNLMNYLIMDHYSKKGDTLKNIIYKRN